MESLLLKALFLTQYNFFPADRRTAWYLSLILQLAILDLILVVKQRVAAG